MNKKKTYILGAGGLLVAILVVFALSGHNPVCPVDYPDTDAGAAEYKAGVDKFTEDFFINNPGAGYSAWASARRDFWEKNKCTDTIKMYNEAKEIYDEVRGNRTTTEKEQMTDVLLAERNSQILKNNSKKAD